MSEKNLLFFYYNFDSTTLFRLGERQLWGSLNTPKSLMTLMTVTLMTGFRYWKMKMTDNEFDAS